MRRLISCAALPLTLASFVLAGCGGGGGDDPVPNPLNGSTYAICTSGTLYSLAFGNGTGTATESTYAAADCSGTATSSTPTPFTYSIASNIRALDGELAAPINITADGATAYTIYRLSGGPLGLQNLNFGATEVSSAGRDGTANNKRHDGIDTTETLTLR
jgi:hypothetical protein